MYVLIKEEYQPCGDWCGEYGRVEVLYWSPHQSILEEKAIQLAKYYDIDDIRYRVESAGEEMLLEPISVG